MKNNGSFKNIGKTVSSEYQDGVKVYLESGDDEYIIGRKWFSKLKDKISFEAVSDKKANGGCQLVIKRVESSSNSNNKTFGIVDRDVLLAHPNFQDSLWWETNNHIFSSTQPYKNVFILHRWELENYLLHPNALASLVADKKLAESSAISSSSIADLLNRHERELIAVTLLSTVPTKTGSSQAPEKYGLQDKGEDLITKIAGELGLTMDSFIVEQEKISRFAEDEIEAIDRWNKLSRLLDGKRIMYRIEQLLSDSDFAGFNIPLQSERGYLAGYLASQNLIDPMLSDWLNNIYQNHV
ncbi:DUF4435 domain-containing protein [Methylomonas albis]|uniref:DUF4435 domain-containing protein n=1 Tax=Methylomonas albis TaxID=1854563 RepID=A0ABR9D6V0_9GAMM|nr:DUF4435 domain-containing protein [Methylomonas albis]MBD9358846.1 DUF4435 domain-containing protein [Methylomonas albis]